MSKSTSTLRTKLHTRLAATAAARTDDPLPDTAVERRFRQWSDALRAVVSERLSDANWKVAEWSNNPMCDDARVFSFHYDGRVEPVRGRPLFVSTRMQLDTGKDLETELGRLTAEARWYRECADQMYRSE